jgi:hypothetical protein
MRLHKDTREKLALAGVMFFIAFMGTLLIVIMVLSEEMK